MTYLDFDAFASPRAGGWTTTMLAGWNLQVFDICLRNTLLSAMTVGEKLVMLMIVKVSLLLYENIVSYLF